MKKSDSNGACSTAIGPLPSAAANRIISFSQPYACEVEVTGTSDMLFHRWNVESIAVQTKAAKGSKVRRSDDLESYVYRNNEGMICVPGEYLRQAIIHASKYRQDPRSPRKSMFEMSKAAVIALTPLASVGKDTWDYEDRRRVMVQRNGVTRTRPAFLSGWQTTFQLLVNLPEYIPPTLLQELLLDAGRLIGLGGFRPTYGRFVVSRFEVLNG